MSNINPDSGAFLTDNYILPSKETIENNGDNYTVIAKEKFTQDLKTMDGILNKVLHAVFGRFSGVKEIKSSGAVYYVKRSTFSTYCDHSKKADEAQKSWIKTFLSEQKNETRERKEQFRIFANEIAGNKLTPLRLIRTDQCVWGTDTASRLSERYQDIRNKMEKPGAAQEILSNNKDNIKIVVQQGDIAKNSFATEKEGGPKLRKVATVNAANPTLRGSGTTGTNKALFEAHPDEWRKGRELLENALGKKLELSPGEAVRTFGGVGGVLVHALGPKGGGNNVGEKEFKVKLEQVYSATYNVLELANDAGCTHVQMPEFSTGSYGENQAWNEAANSAQLKAIEDFQAKVNTEKGNRCIEEIRIIRPVP